MKRRKRRTEILAFQDGGELVRQFNWNRNFLSAKHTRPELQVQRYPPAQLNRHQHGVWV